MKIVLDTNVLISAIFFSGVPYEILKDWQNGTIKIVISKEILTEYQRVAEDAGKRSGYSNVVLPQKSILTIATNVITI